MCCKPVSKALVPLLALALSILPAALVQADPTWSMDIAFGGYTGGSTLTDYPALVVLHDGLKGFNYSDFANPTSGGDLRFYDSGGNELNYEIESWNTSGSSYVWVQVPSLSTGTSITAQWGDSSKSAPSYAGDGSTWSSSSTGYLGVYHLNTVAGDSTANNNDGIYTNSPIATASGIIAGGVGVSGGSHVNIGGSDGRWEAIDDAHVDSFTMSAWVNPDATSSDQTVIGRFGGQFLLWLDAGGGLQNYVFYDNGGPRTSESSGIAAIADEWQLVTATGDGVTLQVYVNGVLSSASGGDYSLGANSEDISLGTTLGGNTGRALAGLLDEARIGSVAFSADWILADYVSQSAPYVFATYGAASVPEPSTLVMLLGLAAVALLGYARRRRKS